jgi:hypothetical protein
MWLNSARKMVLRNARDVNWNGEARLGFQVGDDALKGVAMPRGYAEDERKRQQSCRTPY